MTIEADSRRFALIDEVRSDIAIAMRGMRRSPMFAAVVLLTLALGIGANTAVFSVVRRVLITTLPFRAPNELYRLYTVPNATDGDYDKLSAVELTDVAKRSTSVAGLTLFGSYMGVAYSDDRSAEIWQSVSVAPNFFDVLGLRPVAGRVFREQEFERGAATSLMITYQLWKRLFDGDPRIEGKTVQLNGKPATIVGVLPEHFVGPTFNADMLLPLNVDAVMRSTQFARARVWRSVARLKPGVTLDRWRAELAAVRPGIQAAYPEIKNAGVIDPKPLHEAIVGGAGPVLRLVMAAALLVLLAACVNIAGLFLSRSAARRRELGVRTALGASRGRLARQVLAETLSYGMAGGVVGVGLAVALKAMLLWQAGPMLPKLGDVRIDSAVLAFAFLVAVVSGIAFAVLPAVAATRVDVREAFGDAGGRGASRGSSAAKASRLMVSAQIAFAVALVVGAGLLMRTFATLLGADLGYATTKHQATFFLGMGARYQQAATQREFVETFVQRLHGLPGVTAVGYTVTPPWNGSWRTVRFHIDGRSGAELDPPSAVVASASSEFFKAAGTPVRMGRDFGPQDRLGSPPVVVISESMARRFWPNSSPIGARVRLEWSAWNAADTAIFREVVGVVSDVREDATTEPSPTVYVSAEQTELYGASFVVRTSGEAAALLPVIKATLGQLDSRVPLVSPRTMREVLANIVRRQSVAMTLIALFAVLALLLAGLGVYGIMAYSVASRTREFGIRSALGATKGSVVGLILREGLALVAVGSVAGLLLAAATARFAGSLLVGVTTHDPVSYVGAVVVLAAIALVACLIPARAATRIEPVEALRIE